MGAAANVLQYVIAAAVLPLAPIAIRNWVRDRERSQAYLALSVNMLAALLVLGRLDELTAYRHQVLADLVIVALMVSGLGLLGVRHALVPLTRRMWGVACAATAAAGGAAVAMRLPRGDGPDYSGPEFAVVIVALVVWGACVAEPAHRFWVLARTRPAVQRARLRGLSTVYSGVVVVVTLSVVVGATAGQSAAFSLALQLAGLALLPVLYVSLTAPGWLRRWWRRPEERALHEALHDLVLDAPATEILAERALRSAVRLVGGESGAILDANGSVVADLGEGARVVRDELGGPEVVGSESRVVRLSGPTMRYAMVTPLPSEGGTGAVVVLSGPFTPFFGAEELGRLSEHAAAVAGAFDRMRLLGLLARQTDRYEKLLQAVSDLGEGFLVVEGPRLTFVNEAVSQITGYSTGELLALPDFRTLLDPDEAEALVEWVDNSVAGEAVTEPILATAVRADGGRRIVELAAKTTDEAGTVIVVVRDVTARKRAEALEQRRIQQLANLASVTSELASRTLQTDDLLHSVVGGVRRVILCRSARLTLVGPDGAVDRQLHAGDEADRGAPGLEVPLVHDGSTIGHLELIGPEHRSLPGDPPGEQPERDFDGVDAAVALSFAVYAAEAIAVSRAFEREHELVRRLQAADQVKDTFLNAVSHDLRTPLTVLLGMAQTLQNHRERLSVEQSAELLAGIERNAAKLNRLLGELLDLDRLNRGILEPHRAPVDVSKLIHSVVADTGVAEDRPVEVIVEPLVADLDGPKVERIIENLLINVRRHTDPGTPVWVRAAAQGEAVLVSVEDAGPGVPEALRGSVFEPFKQGSGAGVPNGVGIGLSLVARFAELHGGRAWVDQREGGGAAFRVLLPGRTGDPVAGISAAESAPA